MGFSIPKFEIPKLPEVDVSAAADALTKAYDPSNAVGAMENNIMSQLDSIESVRSQLESLRQQAQKASAQLDFKALSDYTASMQQMTDVSCIMSSAKPAFTPMTPDSLSNPLATTGLGEGGIGLDGLASEAIGAYLGVDPTIVDAVASGDIDTLTSPDTLSDLAIAGAGTYVSGMTGGVIPPQMASSVIDSVAGDVVNSTISSTMSGDIPNIGNLQVSEISGSNALSVAKDAIGADASGNLLGATLEKSVSNTINTISDKALSNITKTDLTNIANSTVSSVGASRYGTDVGGFNLSDPSSLVSSAAVGVMRRSCSDGNIYALSNMLDLMDEDGYASDMFESFVQDIGPNLKLNPETTQLYSDMYDKYVKKENKTIDVQTGIKTAAVQVLDAVNITNEIFETKLGEKIVGKDRARKTRAILDIASSRRSAPRRSIYR